MNYAETIAWLFEQFPAYHNLGEKAYNPGMKNTEELCAFFDNPHRKLQFIHVAGTNGKGSVSNYTASILQESGLKTGLFTSPHIFDFRERIRVNGKTVDESFVIDFCMKVKQNSWSIQPSFFEITWVMALVYFEQQACEIVLAEVGLGGRLDATNIITPLLSVITNIGLDHTHILGNTRTLIAAEKGGIIKKNVPVIIGEHDAEVLPVFESISKEKNTELIFVQGEYEFALGYQKKNLRIVELIIEQLNVLNFNVSKLNFELGIKNVVNNTGFWGRMSVMNQQPFTLVDCAHNAEGIAALLDGIKTVKGNLHIIYGTSSDKDLKSILKLFPKEASYYVCEFSSERTAKLAVLKPLFEENFTSTYFFDSPTKAYESAQQLVNKDDTILIFGSFFLIHDFYSIFFPKTLAE